MVMMILLYIFLSIIGFFALALLWACLYIHFNTTNEEKDEIRKKTNDKRLERSPSTL